MRERLRHGVANPSGLLNGTWLVVAGELGGVRLPADAFDELTLTFWNGRVTLGRDRGLAALDRDIEPAALDVIIVAGPNRGRFVPAIVERAGPLLRICYDLGGTERPGTFEAPAGTRYFLATYRRAAVSPGLWAAAKRAARAHATLLPSFSSASEATS